MNPSAPVIKILLKFIFKVDKILSFLNNLTNSSGFKIFVFIEEYSFFILDILFYQSIDYNSNLYYQRYLKEVSKI